MIFYDHIDEMTLFNDAMDASGMAWWLLELPSGLIFYNPNKLTMLGYDKRIWKNSCISVNLPNYCIRMIAKE